MNPSPHYGPREAAAEVPATIAAAAGWLTSIARGPRTDALQKAESAAHVARELLADLEVLAEILAPRRAGAAGGPPPWEEAPLPPGLPPELEPVPPAVAEDEVARMEARFAETDRRQDEEARARRRPTGFRMIDDMLGRTGDEH